MLPAFPAQRLAQGTQQHKRCPAPAQNLMLAAVGLGLATRLLTLHRIFEAELKSLLAIPAEVETVALIPLGYPDGQFKLRKRLSVDDITHWERWRGE